MMDTIATSRQLLRRLRSLMARPESAQEKLNQIVVEVAAVLRAEVSSVYVRRKDGSLELFATQGLAADAVHRTRLQWGEGLVGRVARTARPVNVRDAPRHPDYVFRPETREQPFHAFLGVPVIREGNVIGVLTVQNRQPVSYSADTVEALETTAMLLAELLAADEMRDIIDPATDLRHDMPHIIPCQPIAEGLALGTVIFHEPRLVITERFSEDTRHQLDRLARGLDRLERELLRMMRRRDLATAGAHRDVLEAYAMIARDAGWHRRLREAVRSGLTAEAAVDRVQNENRARLHARPAPFLRDRLADLGDLSNRLLRILLGHPPAGRAADALPEDAILLAHTLGPAELLDYDHTRLRGLVLEETGPQSHVAIVARALGLAALGGAANVLSLAEPGDAVVVDALAGECHIRPRPNVITAFREKLAFRAQRQARYRALRHKPAQTRDGVPIKILMNAGLLVDLPQLEPSGASGIGLFRTELQFMISATFPRQDRQQEIYSAVLAAAGDRPVVFRTLDIGGDKLLPYLRHDKEQNPALGWRAVRMVLDRPALFRPQIRALLRAARGRELRLMLPMISDVAEFVEAREGITREQAFLAHHQHPLPSRVHVGAMIEVPSLLWQLDLLLPRVDFISVGTNDLLQFLFAADRGNTLVNKRFDPLNPAVLRALRQVVEAAERHRVPVTLCGDMAGDRVHALALIGLGFRAISMAPGAIGPVKEAILQVQAAELEKIVQAYLTTPDFDLRARLETLLSSQKVRV